ncbi:MAG TPA: hydroxymethylbilane synthase [Paenibacillaceae bacterium]
MRTIIVGSRKSALAMAQTKQVISRLERICAQRGLFFVFEVKPIVTRGDRILDVTLSKVGGKGLFVKEIEQALLDGAIDMAVHSLKDLPHRLPDGLVIGAVPPREDPRDCLVSRAPVKGLDDLPRGAKVGTSSLRREAQLRAARPDLRVEPVRGNIDTRLRKLETEGFDAVVLAAAGLHRMGWQDRISAYLPVDVMLPAVGQGALAVECRAGDETILELLAALNDEPTARAVAAERRMLGVLDGGCQVPIGAYAETAEGGEGKISLTGMVASPSGDAVHKVAVSGEEPERVGEAAARQLLAMGADRILAAARTEE